MLISFKVHTLFPWCCCKKRRIEQAQVQVKCTFETTILVLSG